MVILKYSKVEEFVKTEQRAGNDVRWDGWDMVFFYPKKDAFRSPSGRFHNGQWGFETRVSPGRDGKWRVPTRVVRTIKNAGRRR